MSKDTERTDSYIYKFNFMVSRRQFMSEPAVVLMVFNCIIFNINSNCSNNTNKSLIIIVVVIIIKVSTDSDNWLNG